MDHFSTILQHGKRVVALLPQHVLFSVQLSANKEHAAYTLLSPWLLVW